MKTLTVLLVLLSVAGCANMTPRQKQTAVIATAIVVGAIIISSDSDGTRIHNGCHGSCRNLDEEE